ncbi:MAG TPA: response regulator transcription factor [Clostridiaceae bacterium]|jgi:DNA-binding NarL/FixJ family response regulator|nr:response regulator transcription factor [Clostridiaceae bacterium]
MKVLVVDDHPLVRKGIKSTLAAEGNIEEIWEASSVDEAVSIMALNNPDITILDINLGNENGLEAIKAARKRNVATKFIILTSSSRKEDFVKAQELEVDGYILKEAFIEDVIYAFHVVSRGKKFYDLEIVHQCVNQSKDQSLEELSPREKDVLVELGKGLSNTQIAEKLFISEHTVKKHVSSILSKLNLCHRTEAALFANRNIQYIV